MLKMKKEVRSYDSTNLDLSLREIKGLKWLPFIGKNYQSSPTKLLLLGLSHYEGENHAAETENHTRKVIIEQGIEGLYKTKFISKIEAIFFKQESPSKESTRLFWDSIAFCNLVQFPMKTSAHKANTDLILQSWPVVLEVVNIIGATDVVLCSSQHVYATTFRKVIREKRFHINESTKYTSSIGSSLAAKLQVIGEIDGDNIFNLIKIKHPSRTNNWQEWSDFLGKEQVLGNFIASLRRV